MHPLFMRKKNTSEKMSQSCQQFISAEEKLEKKVKNNIPRQFNKEKKNLQKL